MPAGLPGPRALRVRLTPLGPHTVAMAAFDEAGALIVSVESVTVRQVSAAQLATVCHPAADSLFRLEWSAVPVASAPAQVFPAVVAVLGAGPADLPGTGTARYADLRALTAALDAGGSVPDIVIAPCRADPQAPLPDAVRSGAHAALALLRGWLGDERLAAARLVFLTRGAVAPADRESPDLRLAPLWGLVRSAQAEHPGRFMLVDVDDDQCHLLPAALATGEPQLAIRARGLLAPRLVRALVPADHRPWRPDPDGTVLITGGTGGLGALLARHLVAEHGAVHLLLVSRRGLAAEGAAGLAADLASRGAAVHVAACDVSSREEVGALLASIDEDHPLTAVIHAAGVLDDGVVESLTNDRIDRVLAPKMDAALHLQELTERLGVTAFVLFSSLAGMVGGPGQGNTPPPTRSSTRSPSTVRRGTCPRSPWPGGCGSRPAA